MGLFDDTVEDIETKNVYSFRPACGFSCTQCNHCNSPKLSLIAKKKQGFMFIAGEPTVSQDKTGDVWTGSYKSTLLPLLDRYKVDMNKVSFAFAVSCCGTGIKDDTDYKYNLILDSCESNLMDAIEQADPAVLIPLDTVAWDAITRQHLTGRIEKASFTDDFAYHMIPDQTVGRWVAPMLSPVTLSSMMQDRKRQDDYSYYARKTKKFVKEVFTVSHPFPTYTNKVEVCDDLKSACTALKDILEHKPEYLAFDFETEGLKLERADLDIVCVSLAYNNTAVSMPFYKDEHFRELFNAIMQDRCIGKIAHHAKYEARCCLNKLGACPEPWAWDSMYGARILNNRVRCGLKPQTYINFGTAGYDVIEDYFAAESEQEEDKYGENRRNKLQKAFDTDSNIREKALTYVGLDALFTLRLALKQMEEMDGDEHLKKGEQLFRSFINPLVRAEVKGLVVDRFQVTENIEECEQLLTEAENAINSDSLLSKWDGDAPFDYNKATDLSHLLYDIGGIPKEYTSKGQLALDADALEKMPLPITDSIIEARQVKKIRDTYLVNLKKEAVRDLTDRDYKIHSVFNLHVAQTFRSSSSGGLNTQNISQHNKRASNLIKGCILPPKGKRIIGFDFKALECAIGVCIHHDENMRDFITNGGDMHKASMMDIFKLSENDLLTMDKDLFKTARGYGKRMNFSSFYGAGYSSVGNTAWKSANRQEDIMKHLKSVGLGDYDAFMEHMKQVCQRLWDVQFPQYGQWRRDTYDFYQNHGYVELIDGFRCYGPLTMMQATNSPIQGPASHVLLWAFTQLDRVFSELKLQSYLINEIHDALYIAVQPEEQEEVLKLVHKWMIDEPANKFSWVTCPLAVEAEGTAVREDGGNWAEEPLQLGYI